MMNRMLTLVTVVMALAAIIISYLTSVNLIEANQLIEKRRQELFELDCSLDSVVTIIEGEKEPVVKYYYTDGSVEYTYIKTPIPPVRTSVDTACYQVLRHKSVGSETPDSIIVEEL